MATRTAETQYIVWFNLQVFADGGAGGAAGTGAGGDAGTGATAADAAQQTGRSISDIFGTRSAAGNTAQHSADANQAADEAANPDAAFEALIKGEYKQQYDKRVQHTVKDRLKASKAEIDSAKSEIARYKTLEPTLVALAQLYHCDPEDYDAINAAVKNDERIWEDAALDAGMDVEHYRQFQDMKYQLEKKNQAEQELSARQQAERDLQGWLSEAEKLRDVFPDMDLRAELANPDMVKMLKLHIPLETAYMAAHARELVPQAVRYAAADGAQKAVNAVIAGNRPTEGGAGNGAASITSADVRNMSKAQREALIKRAAAGERITFH